MRRSLALTISMLALCGACVDDGPPAARPATARPSPRAVRPPPDPDDAFVAFRRRCFEPGECDPAVDGVYGMVGRRAVRLTGDPSDRDPAWSPDGRRLAFARCRRDDCDLWVLDVARGRERRLTRGRGNDGDPAWSPEAKRLVFRRCERGAENTCELWTVRSGGTRERRITRNDVADAHPDWSGRTGAIVFDRGDCPSGTSGCRRAAIYVARPDGSGVRLVARSRRGAWTPRWDPRHPRIVYDVCRGLCVGFDRKQGSPLVVLRLRRGRRTVYSRWESVFSPSFSPDGRRLVFAIYSGDNGAVGDLTLRTGREHGYYSDYEYHALTPDLRPRVRGAARRRDDR